MAELAIDLPVFVASPGDVKPERAIAEEEIRNLASAAAVNDLLITPILWESAALPGVGRPQDLINPLMERAELVIVVFSSSLGRTSTPESEDSGTLEELFRATEQVFRGSSDDVFVYFRDEPGENGAATERVKAFREQLDRSKRYFFWTYRDPEHFRTIVRGHLQKWLLRWQRVPAICRMTLQQTAPGGSNSDELGENRLLFIRESFRYDKLPQATSHLGREAVRLYQQHGPDGVDVSIDVQGASLAQWTGHSDPNRVQAVRFAQLFGKLVLYPTPLRQESGDVYFSDPEWFAFFCACGLLEAILADDISAVEMKPYVNTVHQYLSALARRDRQRIVPALERWLLNQDGVTDLQPIARNFAAYVLGMIGAHEAEAALAQAARHDTGKDVRLYCVTSLGKLRSRRHLSLLLDLYEQAPEQGLREVLGQAVCRTIGIARYEL